MSPSINFTTSAFKRTPTHKVNEKCMQRNYLDSSAPSPYSMLRSPASATLIEPGSVLETSHFERHHKRRMRFSRCYSRWEGRTPKEEVEERPILHDDVGRWTRHCTPRTFRINDHRRGRRLSARFSPSPAWTPPSGSPLWNRSAARSRECSGSLSSSLA